MSLDMSDPEVAAGVIEMMGESTNSDAHADLIRNVVYSVHEICTELEEEEVRVSEVRAKEILEDYPYNDFDE